MMVQLPCAAAKLRICEEKAFPGGQDLVQVVDVQQGVGPEQPCGGRLW